MTALERDFRSAALAPADRDMLEYCHKLTLTPSRITPADVDRLRAAGFSDAAILAICQTTAYFAFINRMADGLGVELEGSSPPQ